jgi:hypothetical protein
MATQLTGQSADVNQRTSITAWLPRNLMIAAVLMVLIAGAVEYGLFAPWASVQGGPELAPGTCAHCHIGYATPDFTGQMV